MTRKCDLTIRFVQKEDNAELECESPLSDSEILSWEQQSGELGTPTFNSETKVHDISPDSLTEMTDTSMSRLKQQEGGYMHVLSEDSAHNNEQQPGRSHPRPSCAKRNICVVTTVLLVVIVIVTVVTVASIIPKIHQADGPKPLGVDAQTDLNQELDDKHLCWRTNAPRHAYSKITHAFPMPVLERIHKIDGIHPNCNANNDQLENDLKECNDNKNVENYDEAEKLLQKMCDTTIKCCHVKLYGQRYFSISGNGTHQIANLICENYESDSTPLFQCKQGWGGSRCNETKEIKIDCRCFQHYSLCEDITDCSDMMYLDEQKSLCSKHNLTHCQLESHICRTNIQGKECLCITDAHSTEGFISVTSGMKGQQNLMNGAAVLELFNGTSTRNSIVVILLQIYIHLELLH